MENLNSFFEKIDKSFLLNINEKDELKSFIEQNESKYKIDNLENSLNEKIFINNFLKNLLNENNKDLTYIEIHNNMRKSYMKQIIELEENEKENLENIFANFA